MVRKDRRHPSNVHEQLIDSLLGYLLITLLCTSHVFEGFVGPDQKHGSPLVNEYYKGEIEYYNVLYAATM